ncbi:MAG: hypothetical protein AB7O70_05600, partial [Hyphomicrobiales bacterium]
MVDAVHALRAGLARAGGREPLAYLVAIVATIVFIAAGSLLLGRNSPLAVFLFDYAESSFFWPVYPLTIQNIMYLMSAIGLADLWVRWRAAR